MRRPGRKTIFVSGGVLTALSSLAALMAIVAKKRYLTGESKVKQLSRIDGGLIVVLEDGRVFWAPLGVYAVLKTYDTENARPLPYRIDQYRRASNGLGVGSVNTTG